ncbi:hypothetical protein BDN72DRAFT_739745, partial [Pluteus cervinus]
VPFCHRCLLWGHTIQGCRSAPHCLRCGKDHPTEAHNARCLLCRAAGDTITGCTHPPHCRACNSAHFGDSQDCGFYKNR